MYIYYGTYRTNMYITSKHTPFNPKLINDIWFTCIKNLDDCVQSRYLLYQYNFFPHRVLYNNAANGQAHIGQMGKHGQAHMGEIG